MAELTLTGLRVILEVVRTGSFSAAAERLGYTQSAVSRQVAASERAAGGRLFERRARGVQPTPAGQVLVRHAGLVLQQVDAAAAELAGMRDRLAGRVAVGGYPTVMAHLVPQAVARLLREHPAVQVRLVEASSPVQLTALRRGRLEVAVVAVGDGLPDLDLDGLARSRVPGAGLGVAVAVGHRFAGREWVDPEELVDQRWVVGASAEGSPEFGAWPGARDPQIAFAVRSWPARLGLVCAGLGIALVPASAAATVPQGVCWVAVRTGEQEPARTTWALTAPAARPVATAVAAALVHEARSRSRQDGSTP